MVGVGEAEPVAAEVPYCKPFRLVAVIRDLVEVLFEEPSVRALQIDPGLDPGAVPDDDIGRFLIIWFRRESASLMSLTIGNCTGLFLLCSE